MANTEYWLERARAVRRPEELRAFAEELTEEYEHDYDSIMMAAVALMLAAFYVVERSEQGSLTGHQVACVKGMLEGVL